MEGTALPAYYALINLAAFFAWGIDKALARFVPKTGGRRNQGGRSPLRRIPERTLLLLALLGGVLGCWAGVLLFRHKLRKPGVLWPLFGFTVLHAALLAVLYLR